MYVSGTQNKGTKKNVPVRFQTSSPVKLANATWFKGQDDFTIQSLSTLVGSDCSHSPPRPSKIRYMVYTYIV